MATVDLMVRCDDSVALAGAIEALPTTLAHVVATPAAPVRAGAPDVFIVRCARGLGALRAHLDHLPNTTIVGEQPV